MHNNFLIIFALFSIINCSAGKVCQSPEGNEVDWYVIFFMPKAASSDEEIYYAYFDDTLNSLEYYLYEEIFFLLQ